MSDAIKQNINGYAIASFILFLVGLPALFITSVFNFEAPAGIILELSIMFGILALLDMHKNNNPKGKVMTIISIAGSVLFLALIFIAAFSVNNLRPRIHNFNFPAPTPSIDDPITVSSNTIVINPGQIETIYVGIFNIFSSDSSFKVSILCGAMNPSLQIQSLERTISRGNYSDSTIVLQAPSNAIHGVYLCTVVAVDEKGRPYEAYNKDITIEIQ